MLESYLIQSNCGIEKKINIKTDQKNNKIYLLENVSILKS